MPEPDEAEVARDLARRIHAGDRLAESELFTRYGPPIMRLLRALSRNRVVAEDAHQETFVIVLSRLRRLPLDSPERLGHFVCRTARNVLWAGNRRRRFRAQHEAEADLSKSPQDGDIDQLAQVLAGERAALIQRAIARMRSARYRQVLRRFYLDEDSKESICADLGVTPTHFNRLLFRARRRLLDAVRAEPR